jgi:alanine racemase
MNMFNDIDLPASATRLYVDVAAVKNNFRQIQRAVGANVTMMPMVKANAYGCGAEIVAKALSDCSYLAVADVKEAVLIKRQLTGTKIMIVYQPTKNDIPCIIENGFIPAVSDLQFAEELNRQARIHNLIVPIHAEINSGAGRLGVDPDQCSAFFTHMATLGNITVEGIFTHYICADSTDEGDMAFTALQTEIFKQCVTVAERISGKIQYVHACSGAAIFNKNAAHFNMVRPGYMLYGYYPSAFLRECVALTPALRLSSTIIQIRDMQPGTPISYGRTYYTKEACRIATISIGYSDGLSRSLSNKGHFVVNGQRAPIVGRVCMDLTMIDVTGIAGEVRVGDEVDVFDNEVVTVEEIAKLSGTIGYEVIAGIEDKADRVEI